MSYTQYGLIEATDYNNIVGAPTDTAANKLNTIWGVGYGGTGYGQTPVAQVAIGGTVTASNWATLVNTQANIGAHTGTSITSISAPSSGQSVTALTALPTNVTTLYGARFNAATQGPTFANVAQYLSSWSSSLTFTHTVSFASGDAARYFFNAGGQLSLTASHPAGAGINGLLNQLCLDIGTVVMSSINGGTISIGGTTYSGITKIGGGGNTPTTVPNHGYYALTTSNTTVFTQTASTGPSSYLGTNISIIVKSNGTQGSLGDSGSVITISTVWDEVPDGLVVNPGSITTVTVRPPATVPSGYIANTWGTVTVTNSISGS